MYLNVSMHTAGLVDWYSYFSFTDSHGLKTFYSLRPIILLRFTFELLMWIHTPGKIAQQFRQMARLYNQLPVAGQFYVIDNVGKKANQPMFDGLYHPFMMILGMVYYGFKHTI